MLLYAPLESKFVGRITSYGLHGLPQRGINARHIEMKNAARRFNTPQIPNIVVQAQNSQQSYLGRVSTQKATSKVSQRAKDSWVRLQTRLAKYTIEGLSLAAFMIVLSTGAVALEHPASPLHQALPNHLVRRALMGLLAGGWLVGLIYSAWGQKSGAHINPAVTLSNLRLKRISWRDAVMYIAAQVTGAIVGMQIAAYIYGDYLRRPSIDFITTTPGTAGSFVALLVETLLSFLLMSSIIFTSDRRGWQRTTGLLVGLLILTLTMVAAPISGLSLNPARTLGSAVAARNFNGVWLYMIGPVLGMQLAVELLRRRDIRRALSLRGKV